MSTSVTLLFKEFAYIADENENQVPCIVYTGSDENEYVNLGVAPDAQPYGVEDGVISFNGSMIDKTMLEQAGATFIPVVEGGGDDSGESTSDSGSPDDAFKNGDIIYIKVPENYKAFIDRPAEFNDLYKAEVIDTDFSYAEAQIIYKDESYGPRIPIYTMIGKTTISKDEPVENKLQWNFVWTSARSAQAVDDTLTYDVYYAINPTGDPDWTEYANQTFSEFKTGYYVLGNTNLLPEYVGYDGEPTHTDWKFCLLRQPAHPYDSYYQARFICIVSPDIIDQEWNVNFGDYQFNKPLDETTNCFYDLQTNLFGDFEIWGDISSEQLDVLKTYNGQQIKVNWAGTERNGIVSFGEEEGEEWLNIDLGDSGTDDSLYTPGVEGKMIAGVYLYHDPFPYEVGQEYRVVIDFNDLTPVNDDSGDATK